MKIELINQDKWNSQNFKFPVPTFIEKIIDQPIFLKPQLNWNLSLMTRISTEENLKQIHHN